MRTIRRALCAPLFCLCAGLLNSTPGLANGTPGYSLQTQGGLRLKSDDGEYEMAIGGRIHLDANLLSEDRGAVFGSSANPSAGSAFFRRARLSFTGRAGVWEYNFTPDFAQSQSGNLPSSNCLSTPCTVSNPSVAFQELYVARPLGPGRLTIGQFIPFRSLEDQTSSNEIVLIERAITSSGGLYRGGGSRLFQIGLGYQLNPTEHSSLGLSAYNLRRDSTPATEGVGASLRGTWAPLWSPRRSVHLGLSATIEAPHGSGSSANVGTLFSYAGIRGPTAVLGQTTGSGEAQYLALEAGTTLGSFNAQTEIAQVRYQQAAGSPLEETETRVYHLTVGYFLTGEARPYDLRKGVFRSPKPGRPAGALELVAREEFGENLDASAASAVRQVRSTTLGFNYYFSSQVRLMANYVLGEAERVDGARDRPRTVALRFQMNW